MRAQQEKGIYKTALYLRLSRDDEGTGESSSITTQRGILRDYAKTHGLYVVDEYVDATCIIGTNQSPSKRVTICPYFFFLSTLEAAQR